MNNTKNSSTKISEQKIESSMYRLYEMKDELINTKTHLEHIANQQNTLIQILHEKVEFEDFAKSLKESIDNMTIQQDKLSDKICYIDKIIDLYELMKKQNIENIVNIIDALITYLFIILEV